MELKKRLTFGSLMKRSTDVHVDPDADTPESNAARGVTLFCESGAANSGEEVLHLPTIVEAAVASPTAAAAAAQQIRRFLSKANYERPHVQYNAVMLIRILADNPGQSFTKHMDKQFADTLKHVLRNGQDPSVAQMLRESLDSMERERAYDTNLTAVFAMWSKERGLMAKAAKSLGSRTLSAPAWSGPHVSGGFSHGTSRSRPRGLPPPIELAGRIEEARTSAKLLLQLVQSTPASELTGNELVKEFAERCTAAQRSVQGYIACDDPAPDDDTMLTLIETNEQLSLAASKHQRAVLQARRIHGGPSPSPPISQVNSNVPAATTDLSYASPPSNGHVSPPSSTFSPPPSQNYMPPHSPAYAAPLAQSYPPPSNPAGYKSDELPLPPSLQAGGTSSQRPTSTSNDDNPFADHHTSTYTSPSAAHKSGADGYGGPPEPYHPGFQSTPSYLGRQESSANNLTMHGAQPQIAEEDEREHLTSARPRTPERTAPHQQPQNDVSPLAERNTVTYRY